MEVGGGVMIACSSVVRALCLHSGCQDENQSKRRVAWEATFMVPGGPGGWWCW